MGASRSATARDEDAALAARQALLLVQVAASMAARIGSSPNVAAPRDAARRYALARALSPGKP